MKKTFAWIALGFALAIGGWALIVNAAPYYPVQGGTGTSITPSSGTILIGNGANTYTPAFLTPGANVSITNGSGTVTIAVTGTATGTVYMLSGGHGISLSPATITSSGTIAVNTSTIISDVVASGNFLPSSTVYVASVNGQSGSVTIGIPATTTINSAQATIFKLIGDGTTVTSTVNGTTTTFSIINTGNWAGTWQGVNSSTFLTGNQTITLHISGDATGTASGATSITDSLTITGLQGKALPSLATGTLKYTGGAWTFDSNTYLLSGVNVTTTPPLGGGGALTTAGLTLTCATCLTGNQTITLTGAVTGSGATSIATTYTTSTLFGFFSATSPIVYNSSTGVFSWTNSNNYISNISINGNSGTNFQIAAGAGVTSTVSGATTTLSLNLNATCSGGQFLNGVSATGTGMCATPSGGASSTNVYGVEPILVSQSGVNATTSFDTTYALTLNAIYTFLKGILVNGTTTLASTTSCNIVDTNASGTIGCNLTTYLTAAIQSLDGLATSTITLSTSTAAGTWNITTSGGNTITFTIPPAHDQFYAPSTTIPTDTNQLTNGAGFITTSTNNFGGLTNASITATNPITWSGSSVIGLKQGAYTALDASNNLTVSSTLASSSWKFIINNATTTNNTTNYAPIATDQKVNVTQFQCFDTAGTTTLFFFQTTAYATSTVSSTILSAFPCGIAGNTTTTNVTYNATTNLAVEVTSTAGTPLLTSVHITYTKL